MSNLFNLPDVGEGLTEADVVSWKVAVGETVTVNQILVEIETAKSLVELPSPQAGTVTALLVEEGQTVEVGTPIIEFDGDGSGGSANGGSAGAAAGGSAQPAAQAGADAAASSADAGDGSAGPNLVGYGVRADSSKRRPRKSASAQSPASAQSAAPAQASAAPEAPVGQVPSLREAAAPARATGTAEATAGETAGETAGQRPKVLAKPPVRRLAKSKGVDLADVTATGARGEVTREDLLSHLEAGGPSGAADRSAGQGDGQAAGQGASAAVTGTEERIPFKGVTKFMAQAMVDSAFSAPHVTEFLDVDVTAMMELVKRLKAKKQLGEDVRVSPLLIVAKAVCWAALRNPRINSCFDGDDILVKHYVNLGIAAATPRGLIVPNIKGAHALGLRELALALGELTATARAGRTAPADQTGGTITITNVGVFGVDAGTPIINPGEAAILAFGQVRRRPWVVDDEIVARDITTLAVSADHRLVDGEVISKFLADVGGALEDPALMLM